MKHLTYKNLMKTRRAGIGLLSLMMLTKLEDRELYITELAVELDVLCGTVSDLVSRMEAKGLVRRKYERAEPEGMGAPKTVLVRILAKGRKIIN